MRKIIATLAVLLTANLFLATAQADGLALRFLGTSTAISLQKALYMSGVDLADDTNLTHQEVYDLGSTIAGCWAVPMVDPASEIPLGTGIDCLHPVSIDVNSVDDGISLRALSLFVFDGGTIVTLGTTSVRPFRKDGSGNAGTDFTHMTGSIPSDKSGVIGGTGAYADKVGAARVSGAVNLGAFDDDIITFDCLWLVEVEDQLPPGLSKAFGSKSPIK